jgi:hypothetical protein
LPKLTLRLLLAGFIGDERASIRQQATPGDDDGLTLSQIFKQRACDINSFAIATSSVVPDRAGAR